MFSSYINESLFPWTMVDGRKYKLLFMFFSLRCCVSSHPCNLKVIKLDGEVTQEGFHRQLVRTIHLDTITASCDISACHLLLQEALPSGVYVDVYQINDMLDFGGPKVLLNTTIDVEKTEDQSSGFQAFIYPTMPSSSGGHVAVSVILPVHIRYHRPSHNTSYAVVSIAPPAVYFRCENDAFTEGADFFTAGCDATNKTQCTWRRLHQATNCEACVTCKLTTVPRLDMMNVVKMSVAFSQPPGDTLQLLVPVGSTGHFWPVATVTCVITISACIWIIWTIFNNKTKVS